MLVDSLVSLDGVKFQFTDFSTDTISIFKDCKNSKDYKNCLDLIKSKFKFTSSVHISLTISNDIKSNVNYPHNRILTVTLYPSRYFYHHNFNPITQSRLNKFLQMVITTFKEVLNLDIRPLIVTQVDIFRNIVTNYPTATYFSLFDHLKWDRREVKNYAHSYYWRNKKSELIIYDKTQRVKSEIHSQKLSLCKQLDPEKKALTLECQKASQALLNELGNTSVTRIEARFLNSSSVIKYLNIITVQDLLNLPSFETIEGCFFRYISKVFGRPKAEEPICQTRFDENVALLSHLRDLCPQTALKKFKELICINKFMETMKNLPYYTSIMEAADIPDKSIKNELKNIGASITFMSEFSQFCTNTMPYTSLLKEFSKKALETRN